MDMSWLRRSPIVDPIAVNDDANDILEPDEFAWEWRLAEVPLDRIDLAAAPYFDHERAVSLARQQVADRLPIIGALAPDGRVRLLDGSHRLTLAKGEGLSTIRALIGTPVTTAT